MNKKKEKCFFFDLERQVSFAYVPARYQNHVVHGKNAEWFVGFFLLILKMFRNKKKANGKINLFSVFYFKRKRFKYS